jgi:transcriptional regulator GlxA family with amidase domain
LTRTVGIFLFDNVEVLDFAGPFEVFSTASRVKSRLEPDAPRPFEVITISEKLRPIRARGGLLVQPGFGFTDHPALDILIVPGGDVSLELKRAEVADWIARTAPGTRVTASVCTGAFLLGKAGLLNGKRATTHWEDVADLRALFPEVQVETSHRWIDTGQVITSAGISAGIDMSLHIVRRIEGKELAVSTARQMEYEWHPQRDLTDEH